MVIVIDLFLNKEKAVYVSYSMVIRVYVKNSKHNKAEDYTLAGYSVNVYKSLA